MRFFRLAFAAAALLLLQPVFAAATDTLTPTDIQVRTAGQIFQSVAREGYNPPPFNDGLAGKIFDGYLEKLDPTRQVFSANDIGGFYSMRQTFRDTLAHADLGPCFSIYSLWRQLALARVQFMIDSLARDDVLLDPAYGQSSQSSAPAWSVSKENQIENWRNTVRADTRLLRSIGRSPVEIRTTLAQRYSRQRDELLALQRDDAFEMCMNVLATAFDPHAEYLPPSKTGEVKSTKVPAGIGAVMVEKNGFAVIESTVPGSPAEISGQLLRGDRILSIADGEGPFMDAVGLDLERVIDMLRGNAGSKVRLRVIPATATDNSVLDEITLVRADVPTTVQGVSGSVVTLTREGTTHPIGVLRVPAIYVDLDAMRRGNISYRSSMRDLKRLLSQLHDEKVDGIVLDLRGNSGGPLEESVNVAGLFVGKGPAAQIRTRQGRIESMSSREGGGDTSTPMVVLVDRATAAGAEILVAAIQDYRRGIVIGEATFGRSTLQLPISLKLGMLKYTQAELYRINGASFGGLGVQPDITLPESDIAANAKARESTGQTIGNSIKPASYRTLSARIDVSNLAAMSRQRIISGETASEPAGIPEDDDALMETCEILLDLIAQPGS